MFQILTILRPRQPQLKQIHLILSYIISYPTRSCFSTEALLENRQTPSSSESNRTHKQLSPLELLGIAKTVISKCSHSLDVNKGETFTNLSLNDYFLRLLNVSPEIVRGFWRVSVLKPDDVLEILRGFDCDSGNYEIEAKKVESLWGIFKLASEDTGDFEHLPQSCKIMASMLVRAGLFSEAEGLLSRRESQGILLDCQDVFSRLIVGYVGNFELDRAVSIYERMRGLRLVPHVSSYRALLKYLIELNETQLMHRVYVDMTDMGVEGSVEDKGIREYVVRLLCMDGRVQEARELVKKAANFGIKPSNSVINAICSGYCNKKDYNDLISFFAEVKMVPDAVVGNKTLFSLCRNFGTEQASVFMEEMEELGFSLDEMSFGILIGFSCREGKLKDALIYMSDILSKTLRPHVCSYNALLSGIFKEGMWKHSRDILAEMNDVGATPNLSTFKVLLAGFSKAREFDEVKKVVYEMADHDLIKISSLDDPITTGFMLLDFSPSDVKIRRDNNKGFSKTEFFDNLGNGLYLDTDLDEYERKIDKVLDDAMIPDFNSFITEKCHDQDIKSTLLMVDEMGRWGQEISSSAFCSLLSRLSKARFSIETVNQLLDAIFKSLYQLDEKTLNMLVQCYSKKGFTFRARTLFDAMVQRGLTIENATYSALLLDICKQGDLRSLSHCFKLAQKSNWSPEEKDFKTLLAYLCQKKWLNEALELFEITLFSGPCKILDNFKLLVEELCREGLTTAACFLLEEFSHKTTLLDHMVYTCVINGFCREKKFTEAFEVFDTMLYQNLSPPLDLSIQLLPQLCRTKNFEKAVELKNICLKDQPSAVLSISCALISGLCKWGSVEKAGSLFREALLKGLIPDIEVSNGLIQGYCVGKNLKKVLELLGFMIRNNLSISISSYSNMIHLLCSEQFFFLAMSLKELMLKVGNLPELVLYNILIFHSSSTQKNLLLNPVIDSLQKKGLQLDDVTYNFVVRGFLLCKDISRALHYLRTMINQDFRPSKRTLREVISCLCRKGELKQALSLSQEMEIRGWAHGSVIQNNIVEALLTKGKIQEAVDFLNRMEIKGLIPKNIEYDYLINRLCQHSSLEKSVDLLNIMLLKGSFPESTSYDSLIQGFCKSHMLDKALDLHMEMLCRDLKPSMRTWDVLICSLSGDHRVTEAEKLLKSMIQLGETPSREIFEYMINRYRADKNTGKTSELLKLMQQMGYVPDFDTHWSVISNLGRSGKKDEKGGFLSGLLSGFGFGQKNRNSKVG